MGSPRKVIPIARIARHLAGDTQEDFSARYGVAPAVQIRRELGQADLPEIADRLYRAVIVICAVGRPELLEVVDQDGKRSEARSYLRLAEELQARGLSSLIPRTL